MDCLGDASVLEIQIQALLIENDIPHDDVFPKDAIDCLPINEWSIPEEEYKKRRDFRKECIFTIDPATARDMDDALHCRKIDDNTFEVGVHIADVSYFVKENNPLGKLGDSLSTYFPVRCDHLQFTITFLTWFGL